ncbi:hypothetical protein [Streptomyces sp. NPDC005209]|uniref:hypothetical protein n=1 Tax=Streptomyces sp. NPDC005209 TaxID=3156715 RepID=UPI0033BA86EB
MSGALEKAEEAVREASANTDVARIVAAVLATQQAMQQQPATVAQQATQPFDARKWLTIGGLVVAGGGVACFLALAAALLAVAVAIGGVCATACLLVLRSMWRDLRKGK